MYIYVHKDDPDKTNKYIVISDEEGLCKNVSFKSNPYPGIPPFLVVRILPHLETIVSLYSI